MVDIKPLLLNLPVPIHKILKDYKEVTGVNVTNQIYEAITSWLFLKKLINLESIALLNGRGHKVEEKVELMDESLKFCDGDSCEIPTPPI